MSKFRSVLLIVITCFLATGIFVPVAYSATYDMFAGLYDPKYEGAKAQPPTSAIPDDISPNSVKFMFDTTDPRIEKIIEEIREVGGQLDTMQAIIVDGEWKGIQYWIESVKSVDNPSTFYRTQYLTFQVGPYKALDSYDRYRSQAPSNLPPNGKWYDMSYITSDYIKDLFSAYYPDEEDQVVNNPVPVTTRFS